jgi:hypothetical protein
MSAYEIVVSKPEQKRPLERPGHRRDRNEVGRVWAGFISLDTDKSRLL